MAPRNTTTQAAISTRLILGSCRARALGHVGAREAYRQAEVTPADTREVDSRFGSTGFSLRDLLANCPAQPVGVELRPGAPTTAPTSYYIR